METTEKQIELIDSIVEFLNSYKTGQINHPYAMVSAERHFKMRTRICVLAKNYKQYTEWLEASQFRERDFRYLGRTDEWIGMQRFNIVITLEDWQQRADYLEIKDWLSAKECQVVFADY